MGSNQLALAEQPEALVQAQPMTPMGLIQMAAQRGASIEQMQQLFELKLRVEADEAGKEYNEAFAAFKSEAVKILRNVEIKDGPLKGKKHADLYGVVSVVVPALSKHGLSFSWKTTKDDPQWIEITCYLRHLKGHEEHEAAGGPPDVGPGRNAIQARCSTRTYLERYSLLAVLGMASAGQDDDGSGGPAQSTGMAEETAQEWVDAIVQAPNHDALKNVFARAYKAAEAIRDDASMKRFKGVYDKAKAALR